MNLVQRSLIRLAGIGPGLSNLIESAGGLRRAAEKLELANDLNESWRNVTGELRREMKEAEAIAGAGPAALKERFWELELALEDRGWQRQMALSALEFSRYGIQQLMLICRLYYIKNPLLKRAVKVSSSYVFGRGYEITADDGRTDTSQETDPANEALQAFLQANEEELGHLGLVEKDQTLRTDGNLFFVFFTRQSDGQTLVRTIDATEIVDVVCNPNDASEPWFYKRQWQAATFDFGSGLQAQRAAETWYPALTYQEGARPATIGGLFVEWDTPVLHVKRGGLPKWKFGCPEIYASIDWARAYKRFLENWSSITEALARFSMVVETKGGAQAIQQMSAALTTTLGNSGTSIERNPPANVASTFVSNPATKVTPFRTAGATTEPEQGRRVLLMVAAAEGLPETFFGDASTGSLATAKSLDRPTELQFRERQELWRQILRTICLYALARSKGAPKGRLREADVDLGKVTVTVKFPEVLEHDVQQMVAAITSAATLDGKQLAGTIDIRTAASLLLTQLGVQDAQKVVDAMYPPDTYDPEQFEDEEEEKPEPDVSEAVRLLLEASERMKAR